jgi:hypothetical protein
MVFPCHQTTKDLSEKDPTLKALLSHAILSLLLLQLQARPLRLRLHHYKHLSRHNLLLKFKRL